MGRLMVVVLAFTVLASCACADTKAVLAGTKVVVPAPVAPDCALIPMVDLSTTDAEMVAALERPSVGGLCLIARWDIIEKDDDTFRLAKIASFIGLCHSYGKQAQLMPYLGKWSREYVQPRFLFYPKNQGAVNTYASWQEGPWGEITELYAALSQFDGQLDLVYSSGGSILNGVEMCLVPQDTWQAKWALIQAGYSVAGYKHALERQIDVAAGAFSQTPVMFMLHYLVHNDPTDAMFYQLASYATSRGVLCNVGFLQADTDNAVFAGRTGGVASCTREARRVSGSNPAWGLVSWSPNDINSTRQAAQSLGARWVAMFYDDAEAVW